MSSPSVYVVTGASRGLGLEFTKQLLERGDSVVAAARNPSSSPGLVALQKQHPQTLSLVTLDTADASSAEASGRKIGELHSSVDVLINNAGIAGTSARPSEMDPGEFANIFKTNVVGPYLVTRALLPLIKKGRKKQIFQISSTMGSIGNLAANLKGSGRYPGASKAQLAYRASKAALNMETLSLAADLQEDGITVVSVCPGHVTTDMGGERGEVDAPESIAGQLKVFDSVTPEDTGKFFNFEGNVVPY